MDGSREAFASLVTKVGSRWTGSRETPFASLPGRGADATQPTARDSPADWSVAAQVPASRANLVYTSQPVFSALFALALLGERPTPATLLGGGLILAAVAAEVADDDPT